MSRLVLIDNYDSFTWNLAQYLMELGAEVDVRLNDQVTVERIEALDPDGIVVSPGPGRPDAAGISMEAIRRFAGKKPILGVCLGHQSIARVWGAEIVRAPTLMHGKTSEIEHDGEGVFAELPNPFEATRYHSLVVDPPTLDDAFEVTARADGDVIMGIRHREWPLEGVQFHPESIMTGCGKRLLGNFLRTVGELTHNRPRV